MPRALVQVQLPTGTFTVSPDEAADIAACTSGWEHEAALIVAAAETILGERKSIKTRIKGFLSMI
jgi:hypothetical protein